MLRIIIIGGIIGTVLWLIFTALGITWAGYLFATIIIGSVGWSLKAQSLTSTDHLMDIIGILCCLGIWLILVHSYEIEWSKALFFSSLLILVSGLINLLNTNNKNE